MNSVPSPPSSLLDIAGVFARYGNLTFGGGSATVAVLREEIITGRQWMSALRVDLSFALSRITPGTNLLAFGTAVGWQLRGWSGALVALTAGSAPSAILAVLVTILYEFLMRNPIAVVGLRGALAATVGVMIITGWTLIRPYYSSSTFVQMALFAGGAFALDYWGGVPPFRILLLAAACGLLWPTQRSDA